MVTRAMLDVVKVDYSPVDRTLAETTGIIQVYAGDVVLNAYWIPLILATTANTGSLGITGTTNAFMNVPDFSTGTVGVPVDGNTANFPRTILVDGNIIVTYVVAAGGGTVTPKHKYVVTILRAPRF